MSRDDDKHDEHRHGEHHESHEHEGREHEERERGENRRIRDRLRDVVDDVVELADAVEDRVEAEIKEHLDDRDKDDDDQDGEHHQPRPHRPTRHPGHDAGQIDGTPLTPGQITGTLPTTTWPGPRKNLHLPYLFMRANPGDTGTRPVSGPFWESPDIYIIPGVKPSLAPAVPPQLGQNALAHADNTIYAHVWNLGRGPARDVGVLFYWCDPSIGFNPAGAHLIGTAFTSLAARGNSGCHRVVKCPESWPATYVNGGHECLLVKVFDVADPMTTPEWDASVNRHIGQRNIHVIPAGQGQDAPLQLSVGQLFGRPATVAVTRAEPTTMPWLQLHTGVRGVYPPAAVPTGTIAVTRMDGGAGGGSLQVHAEDQPVMFTTTDAPPPPGSAHVYRVTATQDGQVFGGYTVVLGG